VIPGEGTAPGVVDAVVATLRRLGKDPVVIRHEVPGFVWNRLQFALLREALWLVENGVADADTIDRVVRLGNARRWRHLGPFETVALGGVETFTSIAAQLFPLLSTATDGAGLERWVADEPELLDELRRRRDEALGRELRAERGDPSEPPR
jgi:3-hydroxybutyryl-CoA dehydrogenase